MPPPPRTRARGKKLPPGAGATAAAKKAQANANAVLDANAVEKAPHVLNDTDAEGTVSLEVDQETTDAKAWIKENVEQEV
ncbi:hypothetical protein BGZ98_006926, partial [Dissophora globulifera]